MQPQTMISVEEARERILGHFRRLGVERKPAVEALGQVIAEDVIAPFDLPPLANTGMDGYAVRAADTEGASEASPRYLKLVANLAAGYVHEGQVGPGEAVRIMTGAPVPDGADAVVPFEETDEMGRPPERRPKPGDSVAVYKAANPGARVAVVDTVTGPYDVIVQLEADDLDRLGNAITEAVQKVSGVQRTTTCLAVRLA